MNPHNLCEALRSAIAEERKATNKVLRLIIKIKEQRAYLDLGFPSLFELLTQGCGYSNASAQRRIESAQLMTEVPDVEAKLAAGQVTMTGLAKAQTIMKAQERATGEKVSTEFKMKVVKAIENQPSHTIERTLFAMMPESKKHALTERRVVIDDEITRHSLNFTTEMSENLRKLKQIHSHRFPNATDADIIGFALKTLLTQTASAAEAKRVKKAEVGCTYKDEVTGRVCGSKYQVQMDHIIPKAKGGTNSPENLRPLCRQHNLLMAEKHFGRSYMNKFRRT